jgi:CubicO group peptidase (beta-lactamase class C family)
METTIADYTRFVAAVMQGAGVSARAKQEMLKPQIGIFTKHQFPSLNTDMTDANRSLQLSYGLGWGVFSSPAGKVFFKEGHDDGWQHYSICFPDKGVAFVFMSNSDNAERIYKELTQRLAGVEIPWEWEGYAPYPPSVTLPEESLRQWVGQYDGRIKATVYMENGRLLVKGADIPTQKLYPEDATHFFLRVTGVHVGFVTGVGGAVTAVVDDEGERYELKRVSP